MRPEVSLSLFLSGGVAAHVLVNVMDLARMATKTITKMGNTTIEPPIHRNARTNNAVRTTVSKAF